jgi:putative ABC transport system permease protein
LVDKIGAKAGGNRRTVKVGNISMEDVTVDGAEPVIGEIEKIDVLEGRYFTTAENNNSMRVAFIGTDVRDKLFPRGDAIGGEIDIRGIPYRVIGVRVAKGTVFGQPQDAFIQLPIKTFRLEFRRISRKPLFVFRQQPRVRTSFLTIPLTRFAR